MGTLDLFSAFIVKNTERVVKLNILHISRTMGQGGAEKIVYQLASEFQNRGGKICVASVGGFYVDRLERQGILHYEIDDLEIKSPQVIFRTFFKLYKILKFQKVEIIHTHHRMAALYASILKIVFPHIKLIYTAHNVFNNKKILTRLALKNTCIVAVGGNVKENLTRYFTIRPEQISVIYNAVYPESIPRASRNLQLDELKKQGFYLVGLIGRLCEQKGIDIFLYMIAEIKKKRKINIKGIVIGSGELLSELMKITYELGLKEDILYLGYQEHVGVLISQLDLVVMPSRWEGFPLLPLEVFAEKKTIVGSDIGGINEIITDGKTGKLVKKNDIKLFAETVSELLVDETLRERLEKNGFEYYIHNFSYNNFIDQYFHLYQQLISKEKE